jgi:hypothetical protein
MNELITALLMWIGADAGYTIYPTQPNIAMVEPDRYVAATA